MKSYYNDKKYYINKALKIAKKCNNEKAIEVLTLLKRHYNVAPIDFIERVNCIKINNIDLFNIEKIKE